MSAPNMRFQSTPSAPARIGFRLQDAQTPLSPLASEGGWGDFTGAGFFGNPYVPSLVWSFRTPKLPLWEKGVGEILQR